MFFDLNVPVPSPTTQAQPRSHTSKKNKAKQSVAPGQVQVAQEEVTFSPAQLAKLESRIDLLIRLGYTVVALNQIVKSKVDSKTHVNVLDPLLKQLRARQGLFLLKRLTIVLDEGSEKGNGLSAGNASLFAPYDIIALHPTSQNALANVCLTHTAPSSLATHIISLTLTAPRLPFRLKHTLVRTAVKNGAVFEIIYAGVLQGEDERRNWWASARELSRVTKGKGLIVSGGVEADTDLRAPRDVVNLVTLLGLAQNLAHEALTTTPKSLLIRAQTRKTYRAILSEPTLILPKEEPTSTAARNESLASKPMASMSEAQALLKSREDKINPDIVPVLDGSSISRTTDLPTSTVAVDEKRTDGALTNGTKRTLDSLDEDNGINGTNISNSNTAGDSQVSTKKRRRKAKAGDSA
ncbi:RNase P subunit p30-domain-containing protein [Phellopilus nigrolimitatus]|nr:RNase P subunit p30-domain-containing protein [Phellopilus nigrolimitatus]KAH8109419.1 RNase P subunit p30-domain-containing protein [Phellopilus nigrolimitatus]